LLITVEELKHSSFIVAILKAEYYYLYVRYAEPSRELFLVAAMFYPHKN